MALNPRFRKTCFVALASLVPFSSSVRANETGNGWCAKAKTNVEHAICDGGQLLAFDETLSVYYRELLRISEPQAKTELVDSQRGWIAERERCAQSTKTDEKLVECVDKKIQKRTGELTERIGRVLAEKRWQEFQGFKRKTYRAERFEFQYPADWKLKVQPDGRIQLRDERETMLIGVSKTVKSARGCVYSEPDTSEEEIRRSFYSGKRTIGGQEFERFDRGWIPSGEERHFFKYRDGGCFEIDVSDNSEAAGNCGRLDDGAERADCEIAKMDAKDLMAYSDGVIRTFRFSGSP